MRFKLVFLDFVYHISFPGNFTVYKWCVTKVAHCMHVCWESIEATAQESHRQRIRIFKLLYEYLGPYSHVVLHRCCFMRFGHKVMSNTTTKSAMCYFLVAKTQKPGHPPSLIRVSTKHTKKIQSFSYPVNSYQRLS